MPIVPPWAPRGSGLRKRKPKGRKRRQVRANRKISYLKKTDMGRIALEAALALKTLKQHEPAVENVDTWHTINSNPALLDRAIVVHPYYLDRSSTSTELDRETNQIYMFNCRGEFEVKPLRSNCETYQLRFIMGWSKGNPDASSPVTPKQGAQGLKLSSLLPTEEDTLDPDHYKVLTDSIFNHKPYQIYNNYVHPSAGAAISGTEQFVSQANWTPFKKKFNFKFNRKVVYDGGDGDDALGWIPFVAMMLYQQHDAVSSYTGHSGTAYPSPVCRLDQHTFFKDV